MNIVIRKVDNELELTMLNTVLKTINRLEARGGLSRNDLI